MKRNAVINGRFTATNAVTGEDKIFDMSTIGWISKNGVFHFGNKVPQYAKERAIELFISQQKFITEIYNA